MARQSILVNLSPQIDIKSIHPPSFIDTTGNNSIFELAECISLVQSVPNETKLVINVISSQGTLKLKSTIFSLTLLHYSPYSLSSRFA